MRTDKLHYWTLIAPLLAIGVYLALHGSTNVLAGVMAAVFHAEVVAARVGEPFGAIILALAVAVIELGLIVSILLGYQPEPTLVRDTIHAVVVLVLHGSPACASWSARSSTTRCSSVRKARRPT